MANPVVTYAYINANLRARISKLLPAQALQALAEAASLQETLSLLRDTPYGFIEDIYNRTGDLKLAERDLFKLEIGLYSNVLRHLSGPAAEFTGKLILRFEIENIKNALRVFFDRVVRGRSVEADVHYILYDDILSGVQPDRIVNAESVEQVIAALEPTVYGPVLKQHLAEIPARGTLFRTEAALDRFFYEQVLDSSGKLTPRDRQIAQRLLSLEIDLQNISWVMRLQTFYSLSSGEIGEYLVPHGASFEPQWMKQGGETPDFTARIREKLKSGAEGIVSLLDSLPSDTAARLALIESILEQVLHHEVQKVLASYPFTIGIVLAYFVLKQREIRKVRMILNAQWYELSRERIEEML